MMADFPWLGKVLGDLGRKKKTELDEAQELVFEMLCGEDGEVWYKAERYLKANRPDLYNKIGVSDENSH